MFQFNEIIPVQKLLHLKDVFHGGDEAEAQPAFLPGLEDVYLVVVDEEGQHVGIHFVGVL